MIETSEPTTVSELLARAFASRYADAELAASLSTRALAVARAAFDDRQIAASLRMLGVAWTRLDRDTDAERVLHEALALLPASDAEQRGGALWPLASIQIRRGELARAARTVADALELIGEGADWENIVEARIVQTAILLESGDLSGALEQVQRCLSLLPAHAPGILRAAVLNGRGMVEGQLGEMKRAAATMEAALQETGGETGDRNVSVLHSNLCHVYLEIGDAHEALRHGEIALTLARAQKRPKIEIVAITNISDVLVRTGDCAGAISLLSSALERTAVSDGKTMEVVLRSHLGIALLADGKPAEAREELTKALMLSESIGLLHEVSRVHLLLSGLHDSEGDAVAALYHLRRHHDVREQVLGREQTQRLRVLMIRAELEHAEQATAVLRESNEALERANAEKAALLAQLEQQRAMLELLSREDPLTGIANRRHLDLQLSHELARARRSGMSLVLALVDVDHFKSVNDTFSHAVGDEVLRVVARYLRDHLRNIDTVARYGGEEFVLVLADTALEDGARVCDQLRRGLASYNWSPMTPGRSLTVSIGVASSAEACDAEAIAALADVRLYAAKRGGRDRVVASDVAPA